MMEEKLKHSMLMKIFIIMTLYREFNSETDAHQQHITSQGGITLLLFQIN